MKLVVEENLFLQSAFFFESEFLRQGDACFVLREGPPSDLVEVQLFERLLE